MFCIILLSQKGVNFIMSITSAFLLALCTFCVTLQGVCKKEFAKKEKHGDFLFFGITNLFALLFFIAISGNLKFTPELIPYSILFSVCHSSATIFGYYALITGPFAITLLITSYSLMIPTLYGLIFLKDTASVFTYLGIIALVISLFLVRTKSEPNQKKATFKWLLFLIIGFVANGMCSVTQNAQQQAFSGLYKSEFMIIALVIPTIIFFITGFIRERKHLKSIAKYGIPAGGICGISNGISNFLVMVLVAPTGPVNASVFFPILSGGGNLLTFGLSLFLYKEKFLPRQIAGIIIGIISLVLLNI